MEKIKIIMADTDENYLVRLQYKFITEFFNKIDLEIITEKEYFNKVFSEPVRAKILIVSEELYDYKVQKQTEVENIFVLCNQESNGETGELLKTGIYKYTNVNEIFNEIMSKSGQIINIEASSSIEPQLIIVTSATGGVGKTTVAMGIAAALTQNYKKVLYMGADYLQTFQLLLNNKTAIPNTEVYSMRNQNANTLYSNYRHMLRTEKFSYLPPFKSALMSIGIDIDIFLEFAKGAKLSGDYDYVIIDTNSIFDESKAKMITTADKVIIVYNQTEISIEATNILISSINDNRSDKFIFICNNYKEQQKNVFNNDNDMLKFTVDNQIEAFSNYTEMAQEKFTQSRGIKQTSLLLV